MHVGCTGSAWSIARYRITIPPATCEAYAYRALSAAEWAKVLSWAVALEGMLRRKRLLEMCDTVPSTVGKGDKGDESAEDVGSSSGGEEAQSAGSSACRWVGAGAVCGYACATLI